MVALSGWDWAAFGLLALVLLALGGSARMARANALDYVSAGRALTLPAFVATLVVTWYGGILGIGESVSYFGTGTWLLLGVPYYVFGVGYALFLARRVREADEVSIPERLRKFFGPRTGLAVAALVVLLGVPAAHALMLGVVLRSLSGWPIEASILVAAVAASACFVRSGLIADVRAAFVAFPLMFAGFFAIVATCLSTRPSTQALRSLLQGPMGTLDGGQGPLAVATFFVLGAWTLVDPGFHQRAASAASKEVAKRGVVLAVVCWAVFDLLSITAGLYAVALVKPVPDDPLLLFPLLADQVLPPGLKGLFFAGVVGTVLNALVSYALVSGSAIGRDIVARVRPSADPLLASRWGVAVAVLVAVALAWTVKSVVALWYSWAGCIVGALLTPFLLAYFRPGPTRSDTWVAASAAIGFLTGAGWMAYGMAAGNPQLLVTLPSGEQTGLGTLLPSWVVTTLLLLGGRRTQPTEGTP
ncbi:MAG: hypothetical protein AB7F50_08960 [Fimbriimonadaceae bacterium]